MKKPRDFNSPVMKQAQEAVVRLAAAHVAAVVENDVDDGEGVVTASWVGDVLIISANGDEAKSIAANLIATGTATPERAM